MRIRPFRCERGSAIIELALALPLLVVVLVATIDFARVFYLGISLQNAARAGAQWGAHASGQSGNFTLMKTAAENSVTVRGGIVATPSRLCECATDTGTFSPTSPVNDCSATCAAGTHMVITVTVTTTGSFSRVITGIPGLPNSLTLTRSASMRAVP